MENTWIQKTRRKHIESIYIYIYIYIHIYINIYIYIYIYIYTFVFLFLVCYSFILLLLFFWGEWKGTHGVGGIMDSLSITQHTWPDRAAEGLRAGLARAAPAAVYRVYLVCILHILVHILLFCTKSVEYGRNRGPATLRLRHVSPVSVFTLVNACPVQQCIPRFSLYDGVVCRKSMFCGAETQHHKETRSTLWISFVRTTSFYGGPAKYHKVDIVFLKKNNILFFFKKNNFHFMIFRWDTVKTVGSDKNNS